MSLSANDFRENTTNHIKAIVLAACGGACIAIGVALAIHAAFMWIATAGESVLQLNYLATASLMTLIGGMCATGANLYGLRLKQTTAS